MSQQIKFGLKMHEQQFLHCVCDNIMPVKIDVSFYGLSRFLVSFLIIKQQTIGMRDLDSFRYASVLKLIRKSQLLKAVR